MVSIHLYGQLAQSINQDQIGKDISISIFYSEFTLADKLSTGRRLAGWSEQPTSQDQAWILPQPSIKIDPIIQG